MQAKFLVVLQVLGSLVLGCTEHEPIISRRGGPVPDYGADADAGAIEVDVRWCQALGVLETVCQHCHQDPPINTAPFPLVSYENTQAQYYDTELRIWEQMRLVVSIDYMPLLGVDPTVMPLTCEQKTTLLGWLLQGATDEGGLECTDADKTLVECGSVDTGEGGASGAGGAGP